MPGSPPRAEKKIRNARQEMVKCNPGRLHGNLSGPGKTKSKKGQFMNFAQGLSGLPNANAKSPRFSYAISQIAPLPPVVALNRTSKSQIAAKYAAFLARNFPNRIGLFPSVS